MDLLFQRIINEYLIPSSHKLKGPSPALLPFLETHLKDLLTDPNHRSPIAMDILISTMGILRRGQPFQSRSPQNPLELRGARLPQTLSQWGFPFVHEDRTIAEKGNALILQLLSKIKEERRSELFEVFRRLDKKHVQHFLNEIFSLVIDLDSQSLNAVKKYPDLFIESLLWDPFYNPYSLKRQKRFENQLERKQRKSRLLEDENKMSRLWEALFAFAYGRTPKPSDQVPTEILLYTKKLERLWISTLKDYNFETVHTIMDKMNQWTLFYRKELVKRFFEETEMDSEPQVNPDRSRFFEWLDIPEEVILLNDSNRFSSLTKKAQIE